VAIQASIPVNVDPDQEMCYYLICWPSDAAWRALLRGLLFRPARGRYWDRETGIIVDAQSVGKVIEASNELSTEEPIAMACTAQDITDLVLALSAIEGKLGAIQAAVEGIEAAQIDISVAQTQSVSATLTALSSSESFAEALSYSSAEAVTWPTVMPPNIAPPLEISTPPITEDADEYGLDSTTITIVPDPTASTNIACQVAHDIVDAMVLFLEIGSEIYSTMTTYIPLTAWMQLVASAATGLERQDSNAPFILPRPVAAALAASLAATSITTNIHDHLVGMRNFLVTNRAEVADELYCIRDSDKTVAEGVFDMASYFLAQGASLSALQMAQLAILFSVNLVSLMFFERVGYVAPTTNTETCTGCGS